MRPVVELLRVSTELQAAEERAGLAAQHATNLHTCTRFDLAIAATIEVVESGATVARSPQMREVLDLIRSGTARGIVLAEYSRLLRTDRWDDLGVLQTFYEYDAPIYVPAGPIDLQTEPGFIQATMGNMFAAMERRRIRERMDRGKEEHRRRGAHMSGGIGLPLGLDWSREAGWTYTADIERVRLAFRAFLAGERNFAELSRISGLARTTVRSVLQNPVYSGWRVYTERRDLTPAGLRETSRDRRKVERAPDDVIRARLPIAPIVSEEDFALVQQILAGLTARRSSRVPSGETFVYRGFVRCANDNEMLHGVRSNQPNGRRTLFRYVCPSHTVRRHINGPCGTGYMADHLLHAVLDRVVTEQLTDAALLTEAVLAYDDSLSAGWRTARPDLATVQNQLAEVRRRRERVIELFIDGVIDRAQRDARLGPLVQEERALEAMLAQQPASLPETVSARLIRDVARAFTEWRHLAASARRRMLEAISPTFHVRRYDVQGVTFPIAVPNRFADSRSPTADAVATPAGLYIPLRRTG